MVKYSRHLFHVCSVLLCLFCVVPAEAAHVRSCVPEAHYAVPGGEVAEIVAASPDGMFLYYTNASGKKVGVLDISDPANPKAAAYISTGDAEPTSAAVSADGKYLAVVMRNGDGLDNPAPGTLSLYDISDAGKPSHIGDVEIGIGPDSAALVNQSGNLVAVVAIEDEETDAEGEATLGGKRPGRVDVIVLNRDDPAASRVSPVFFPESLLAGIAGVNFTADPQPEFIAIHPSQTEAAVTLQENNAVAIIDISNPEAPKVKNVFCAGMVERKADIEKDGAVDFSGGFKGRREPDAIAYVTVGDETYLAVANEGDTSLKTFGDGVYSGGRGVSLLRLDGTPVWDSGVELERSAALAGHYPDSRSESRSVEVEGCASAEVYDDTLLVAASERGSFAAVYRVDDASRPELLKILPTGIGPEGIAIVTSRSDGKKLLITSNESDGTVNIYSMWAGDVRGNPQKPEIKSSKFPWSALSGFSSDGKDIYAVPDNARAPSCIWRIDMSGVGEGVMDIAEEINLVKDSKPAAYDLEGICVTGEGFWLAAEGAKGEENALVFARRDGTVISEYPISKGLLDKYGDPKNYGFEGLAVSPDGKKIYAALQRGFVTSAPQAAILRFDVDSRQWEAAWYPLEKHSKDPEKYWMGISDIEMDGDSSLLVVERDKGMGGTAEVKRVYSVDLSDWRNESALRKTLVSDILAEHGLLLEKVESLCLLGGNMWIATDNDGAGWTQVINLGPIRR